MVFMVRALWGLREKHFTEEYILYVGHNTNN